MPKLKKAIAKAIFMTRFFKITFFGYDVA
jgi:hypothetical protein